MEMCSGILGLSIVAQVMLDNGNARVEQMVSLSFVKSVHGLLFLFNALNLSCDTCIIKLVILIMSTCTN